MGDNSLIEVESPIVGRFAGVDQYGRPRLTQL